MTATLPISASEDDMGLPLCQVNTYKELEETVMSWLGALTKKLDHEVPRLNHQTMVKLGLPVDDVMDVCNNHKTVQLMFEKAAHTEANGRATPRVDIALKAKWLRLEPTRSTNNI